MSAPVTDRAWSRQRLICTLIGLVLLVAVAAAGLVLAIVHAMGAHDGATSHVDPADFPVSDHGVRGKAYRDAQAARPMLPSNRDDLLPAAPSLKKEKRLMVPQSTRRIGALPSGYPHTPSGAVGQLASIELAALNSLSLDQAREVFEAWSVPGARFGTWEIARAIRDFHEGAGTVEGDGEASLSAVPVGAQIKATDGPDWVIACIQLDVRVSVLKEVRFGYGHCERMQWVGHRWVIAEGTPPAPAPSTWPRSDRSIRAGWKKYVEIGAAHD
ncbi:hypothetical protein ASD11_14570 [Aeromicrobium sp. Root495]|uniref:hypothetical protein n=1 Tax=Aeromicrobium sp. Root495 TaxID=1736550 RepID=UPI0006F8006A|nr:hypothetical protein [Aeromicrobium sp. Root495]KQY55733.1 hypothetical protein ASD11_14570 [Aeromicrobium sp. Root495]